MNQFIQLGQVAIQNKKFAEATDWFTQALAADPKNPQINACLGQSLCWQGRRESGLVYLRRAGELLLKKNRKSRDITLVLELVGQLHYWDDYSGALAICRQAVQINPQMVRGHQLLALTHSRLNQKKPALAAARQALKLAPASAMLAILVASLEFADGLYAAARERLEKVLLNPVLSSEESYRAHKELARVLDKLNEYPQAFQHLQASALVAPNLPEVKNQDATLVSNLLASYSAEFDRQLLGRWSTAVFPAELPAPVFLVGFMRSGTTLTQEVLGAHPQVFVADETDLIHVVVQELKRISAPQLSVPAQLRSLDFNGVLHLRSFYWRQAHALYGDKIGVRLLVDKTTMNSIDIGVINTLFPDAKLIFLLRDPRDVCLSCFMQIMTPTPSTVHLLSWVGAARFYAQLMAWWLLVRPKLTMQFIELRYEDAVLNFETTFRGVFDFLSLNWEAGVADFHKQATGKYIASPSFNQVSQPLYVSAVGRWQKYATEFQEIDEYLQPYIQAFAYT